MTTHRDEDLDRLLDRTLDEIRGERPEPAAEQTASNRVWQRLSRELDAEADVRSRARRIESCADFQALLPDYLAGGLAKPRLLLLEDHLGECVPCRRALKQRRGTPRPAAAAQRSASPGWASRMGWRFAAAAVVFLALVGFSFKTDVFSFESGGVIRIEAVQGELFHVTDDGAVPLKVGDVFTLDEGDGIRTAKDSSALIAMSDASRVELRERSQLAVLRRNHLFPGRQSDGVLDLERGSIIVEASDQGSGHLFVDTQDCNVAVQGTVFSVSHGMKGSRVSVVEGEVQVRHRGSRNLLQAGDQTTTREALFRIPVEQDVAWSRNSDRYVELLREMRALGRELDEALQPELRYATDLLDIAPAGTAVYFAMPNMADELGRAYDILQDRVATSVVLREWWEQQILASGGGGEIERIIDKISDFGDHLGEEIVMTLQLDADGDVVGPLFLTRLTAPDAYMQMLSEQIAELENQYDEDLSIRLLDGPLSTVSPVGGRAEVYFWKRDDILAITPDYDTLWKLDSAAAGHATLAGNEFHERMSVLYGDGVEWLVGVDVQRLLRSDPSQLEQLESMGLLDIQYLIGERKQRDGRTDNRAVLTFDQPRRRLASWIAEPAPMGALDYIGPEANLVGAFVMKDMGVVVDELFELIGRTEIDFEQELAEFEQENGIDVRRDLAYPLGGEFAMALDGPLLPTPSWKVVMEVYDPGRLEQSLEWLIEQINAEVVEAGAGAALSMESEEIAGRRYFRIESPDAGLAVHFVFDDGYLVAGPSRGLLDRALQNRTAGIRLIDSPGFRDLLPRDGEVDFSGVLYQNMSPILDPLSSTIDTLGNMPDEQRQFVQALAAEAKPSLALLYGHEDRITLASSSEGGLFSSMMDQLSGASGLLGMQQSLARVVEHGAASR